MKLFALGRLSRLAYLAAVLVMIPMLTTGLSTSAKAGSPAFVPGLPDVPLMAGLVVDQDATVVFDKPHGRIVEAVAAGPVAISDFLSYYQSALPDLGWTSVTEDGHHTGELSFRREGELLRIEFVPRGDLLGVRFFLSPA